jgi:hypothetical protein
MEGAVSCTCFRDGIAAPHPFPKLVYQPVPGLFVLPPDSSDEAREAHEDWLVNGCPHAMMQLVSETLWDEAQHDLLTGALSNLDGTSRRAVAPLVELLEANRPPAPWPPDRVRLLEEALRWVRANVTGVDVHQVVDEVTGEVLHHTAANRDYCYTGEGHRLGVAHDGIFVARRDIKVLVARRLLQKETEDGRYELTDAAEGKGIRTSAAFLPYDAENPDRHRTLPAAVVHATLRRPADDRVEALAPLGRLSAASRKTGHAILWSDLGEQGW